MLEMMPLWHPRIRREPDERQADLFALSSGVMPTPDLDDDELAAVIAALKDKLDRDRYPRSPRLAPLRSAHRLRWALGRKR